jgi:hypothetical protein
MTYTTTDSMSELVDAFQSLDVDQQLALFYFIYTEMGHSVTPAAPGATSASSPIAEGLLSQVQEFSHEEQLQIQRDLIARKNTLISREYGALSDSTKLLFWYYLAQGMDKGEISPMPADYKLSEESDSLFAQIKGLEFNQQITLFRDLVSPMDVDPNSVEHDPETGL